MTTVQLNTIIYSSDYNISLSEEAINLRWKSQDQLLEKFIKCPEIELSRGCADIKKVCDFDSSLLSSKRSMDLNQLAINEFSLRGKKNEDRSGAFSFKIENRSFKGTAACLFVLDGHNKSGCADFMAANLQSAFEEEFADSKYEHEEQIYNGLKRSITRLQRTWLKIAQEKSDSSGSTLCAQVIIQKDDSVEIWCANVGDSRGFVSYNSDKNPQLKFVQTSIDATLENEKFLKSIKKWGGVIEYGRLGHLNMARALGNLGEKGLCPRPKVTRLVLPKEKGNPRRITVAATTDGLTSIFGTRKIGFEISRDTSIGERLVQSARLLGSEDDISLVSATFTD